MEDFPQDFLEEFLKFLCPGNIRARIFNEIPERISEKKIFGKFSEPLEEFIKVFIRMSKEL